jgi:capsular polysaccharide transport system permease protein
MSVDTQLDNRAQFSEVKQAFALQCRVIMALLIRETKSRYGEYKLGFLWVLLEPSLFIAGFAAIRVLLGVVPPHGMSSELFVLTGFAPLLLLRSTMQQITNALRINKQLLSFPQVTTFDLVFARALLEFCTMVVVFVLLLVILIALGNEVDIPDPLALLYVYVLVFLGGVGLGTFLGAISLFAPSVHKLTGVFIDRPLLFASGVFFTADQIPEGGREILLYNPLLHLIEWFRSAFFKSFESQYYDPMYATTFSLVLLTLGLLAHKAMHKKVQDV